MPTQGPIDHPSYLTRQAIRLGSTVAGANGSSLITAFPNNMRIRNVSAVVLASGSSSVGGAAAQVLVTGTYTQFGTTGVATAGTTTATIGNCVLGTGAVNSVSTSGDCNTMLNAGSLLFIKNGTDATETAIVTIEAHLDPLATWVGGAYG